MAKQLNVNLVFNADTEKAKARMAELQTSLNNLNNSFAAKTLRNPLTPGLKEAQIEATKLNAALQASMNVNTGKFDLSKFNQSLKSSGTNLNQLHAKLTAIGPAGRQAFMSLAQNIVQAEIPTRRMGRLVGELGTVLKNTVKWQFSSSMLHGVIGATQKAFSYAKDLNASLNDIRIVTGASADEMDKFAAKAQKAAKALSATTLDYTKASLIYYQQGLSDSEVQERTNVTVKMANVTKDSAQTVSDQMTAVWNNFDNGSKSLEYYADVMTALGAATASSTSEISEGLEKFAAVADSVGLSYEYATAALATVTATTRQSADVVGTAFKTLFARLQDLELGESLDDGTTLGKYSAALAAAGVNIKNASGELKDMDVILDELGGKWTSLSKDTQIALAQTVAGTRQYTQLVALMDNWQYFQKNLSVAKASEGTLDEQAEIYAESWEAARDRVKAASEAIYQDLLDDDFFIDLLNGLEDVLTFIDKLIDSMGGMKGVLSAVSQLLLHSFSKQAADGIRNMVYNMKGFVGLNQKEAGETQDRAANLATQTTALTTSNSQADQATTTGMSGQIELAKTFAQEKSRLNDLELAQAEAIMKQNEAYREQLFLLGQKADTANLDAADASEAMNIALTTGENPLGEPTVEEKFSNIDKKLNDSVKIEQDLAKADQAFLQAADGKGLEEYKTELQNIFNTPDLSEGTKKIIKGRIDKLEGKTAEEAEHLVQTGSSVGRQVAVQTEKDLIKEETQDLTKEQREAVTNYIDKQHKAAQATNVATNANNNYNKSVEEGKKRIEELGTGAQDYAQKIVGVAQGISSISFAISSLSSISKTWQDDTLSESDKILQTVMSLSMAIPMLINGFGALNKSLGISQGILAGFNTSLKLGKNSATTFGEALKLAKNNGITGFAALGKAMLSTLGPLLAIAAAAFLLYRTFKMIKENSPEYKLKRLKEEAKKASEAFDNITNAIKETNSALDSLESSYEKINNLTKGTEAWKQAVMEANAEVMKLVDENPFLQAFVYSKDGVLKISDEGLKQLSETQSKAQQAAYGAMLRSNSAVLEQENVIAQRDMGYSPMESTVTHRRDVSKNNQKNKSHQIDVADVWVDAYKQYGSGIFSDVAGAELYRKSLSALNLTEEQYSENEFINDLKENKDLIIKMGENAKQIAQTNNQIMDYRLAAIGSNRTHEDAGISYEDIYEREKENLIKNFQWDKNYSGNDAYISEFVKSKGPGTEYVGMKDGKMVLNMNGQEQSFTKDQFYSQLAEYKSGETFEKDYAALLVENFKQSLDFEFEGFELSQLVGLDNLQKDLETTLGKDFVDNILKKTIANFTDGNQVADFMTQLGKIDLSNIDNMDKLSYAVKNISEDGKGFAEFVYEVEKLASLSDLEGKTAFFTEAAEKYGLGKEAADEMKEYAKYLMEIADKHADLSVELETNADNAAAIAVQVARMNKGVKALGEGFAEWHDIIKNSTSGSWEHFEAITATKDALTDTLGVADGIIDNNFVEQYLDKIAKAAEGDAKAIEELQSLLAKDLIAELESRDIDVTGLDKTIQNLSKEINIDVGMSIEDEAFIQAANELVEKAGWTADKANAYFASIGYEPQYLIENVPLQTSQIDTAKDYEMTIAEWDKATNLPSKYKITSTTKDVGTHNSKDDHQVMAISGGDKAPKIKKMVKTATPSMNNYSSQNSGGSKSSKSSKSSKTKLTKKDSIVERYKEINDVLDDLKDSYDDLADAADRVYGKTRLAYMKEQLSVLQDEIAKNKEKAEWARRYYEEDKAALSKAAAAAGVALNINEDGLITNYEEQMTALYDELNRREKKSRTLSGDVKTRYDEESLTPFKEKVEELQDAIQNYDESREAIVDADKEALQKFYEWQDLNAEQLSYALEYELEANEDNLSTIDYYLNKLEDDFYSMAEAIGYMTNAENNQFDNYIDNLKHYGTYLEGLQTAFGDGGEDSKISQQAFVDGLRETKDGLIENLESLLELDDTMMEYYGETLAAAGEELEKYTDRMDHLNGVLDHYSDIMGILGKEKDYNAMGVILGGKANNLKNDLAVAKDNLAMYTDEVIYWKEQMDNATDDNALALYTKNWEEAQKAQEEAQNTMLEKTKEWAEAEKAVVENTLNSLARDLEKSLTGGTSFDTMTTVMERAADLQEEYLTTTNKIYETNKLMRTAQDAIDKTTNSVAKKKLKGFMDETQQLQNQSKLSQYELEIQQAKYNLLLAEIALQEAQDAKSVVRLQRDNEGNFGYVYTADADKVSTAAQELENAQNNLYNIGLEGANDYTEKYQQTMSEMYDTLTQLQQDYLDGAFETEEDYQNAVLAAKEYYYEKLENYSNLHAVALTTDSRIINDAWSSDFSDITTNTAAWKTKTDEYAKEAAKSMQDWAAVVATVAGDTGVGGDLETLKNTVKGIADESDALKDKVKNEVIPELKDEFNAVNDLLTKYGEQRTTLLKTVTHYEGLINTIDTTISKYTNLTKAIESARLEYEAFTAGENKNLATINSSLGGSKKGGDNNEEDIEREKKKIEDKRAEIKELQNNLLTINSMFDYNGWSEDDRIDGKTKSEWEETIEYEIKKLQNEIKEANNQIVIWGGKAVAFDTGGYTGSWGSSSGKLAMVHEKELILDPADTTNFLASMDLLHSIISMIDVQAASAQIGGVLSSPSYTPHGGDSLEQNVRIEANFPNVSDRNEIEAAFDNLINRASQYANRK